MALVFTAACAKKTTTVTTSDGSTVTTSNDNQTATIQTKDGTATYGAGAVDTAKLGAPVYPGASKSEGGMSVAASNGASAMASFSTGDSFDQVYTWYKGHMPAGAEKMKMSAGGQDTAEFVTGEQSNDQVAVMVTAKDGKTQIVITRNTKK